MANQSNPKLHTYIAHAGITSRRKAEELILQGIVKVNGTVVKNVAARVNLKKDIVEVDGKVIEQKEDFVYYLLHKPVGVVSTVSDPDGKPTVMKLVPNTTRVYPVGRLDVDSEGLMLLTNDGDLSYKITHPKFMIKKTYHVLIQGSPTNTALNTLRSGVRLKEAITQPAEVGIVKHEKGNTWISIVIHEGRHRQVRRMCANVNLQVLRLIRMEIGHLKLDSLPEGKWRELTQEELQLLRNDVYSST